MVLSLAGRTQDPAAQPVPVRTGGFGGSDGLASYLRVEQIGLLIDATHPFAEQISINAQAAARLAGVEMFALRRPCWEKMPGDLWTEVDDIPEAVSALGDGARKVFLAIGRQQAFQFAAAPQHSFLIRSIEPITPPLDLPDVHYLLAAGPFDADQELDLLRRHRIDAVVTKNSGGSATYGKIAAARQLGIEVVMIGRSAMPEVPAVTSVEQAVQMAETLLGPGKT